MPNASMSFFIYRFGFIFICHFTVIYLFIYVFIYLFLTWAAAQLADKIKPYRIDVSERNFIFK